MAFTVNVLVYILTTELCSNASEGRGDIIYGSTRFLKEKKTRKNGNNAKNKMTGGKWGLGKYKANIDLQHPNECRGGNWINNV